MKKICLLLALTMCSICLLAGCGNEASNDSTTPPPVVENTESIEYVFKTTFEVKNPEYYDFNLVFESSQDFLVYEIKNRVAELKTSTFTFGEAIYTKEATMEYDAFDLFLYRNGEVSSLLENLNTYRLNFAEVGPIMEEYHSNYETELDTGKIFAERLIDGIYYNAYMKDRNYPVYQMESTACHSFNLGNYDYEWLIWDSMDEDYGTNDIFIAKYKTEEQKAKLLAGIEYRYNNLVNSLPEVFNRTKIKDNTKVYEFEDTLIWVSVMDESPELFKYIESEIQNWNLE